MTIVRALKAASPVWNSVILKVRKLSDLLRLSLQTFRSTLPIVDNIPLKV